MKSIIRSSYANFNSCKLSINNFNENPKEIYLYPNPATDNLTIDVSATLNIPAIIEISNIEGQLIENLASTGNKTNIDHVGWSSYVVDISEFQCGVYMIEVKTEKGVGVKKFIKE